MSRKANPAIVGAFVIGAVALIATSVIILGKGSLFKEKSAWVLYFEGSIKGLTPGSPVVFQGVRIGEVKDIRVNIDKEHIIRTPVVMEIDSSLIDFDESPVDSKYSLEQTKDLIDRGLRAQLQTQSLITGQLLIQLGFNPDKEARFVSPGGLYPEMPTIPSTVQELSKTLQELPLKEIVNNLNTITKGIDKIVNSPDMHDGLAALSKTLQKTDALLALVEKHVDPIGNDLQKVLASTDTFLQTNTDKVASLIEDLEKTSTSTREDIRNVSSNMREASIKTQEQLSEFLENATTTTGYAEKMLSEQSEFRHELRQTLAELESALRAIRLLAEQMEQHPESMIRGKAQ